MGQGDGAADGQPDAGAATVTVAGGVGPVEPFEEVRQVFGRDPVAGVAHLNGHRGLVGEYPDGDPAALRGVPEGVGQQIAQHLGDPGRVRIDGEGRGGRVDREADALAVVALFGGQYRIAGEPVGVGGFQGEV